MLWLKRDNIQILIFSFMVDLFIYIFAAPIVFENWPVPFLVTRKLRLNENYYTKSVFDCSA